MTVGGPGAGVADRVIAIQRVPFLFCVVLYREPCRAVLCGVPTIFLHRFAVVCSGAELATPEAWCFAWIGCMYFFASWAFFTWSAVRGTNV